MLYWQFWNSYLKGLAEAAIGSPSSLQIESEPEKSAEKAVPESSPASPSDNEKYNYLTKYGTQILCMLNEDGCSYLSQNFERITGQKCEARLGSKFFTAVHADYRARLKELLAEGPGEKSPYPFRCKMQHSDKKYYWYLFLIHPKEAGNYVCIVENIHDTMLAQNTLQKARLEAELALRARSEFLANMSHELRTPLNAVIGFSQIIESEMFGKIENPQYLEYMRHIHESGYDLLTKIEDLLEIANIEAGRVQLAREEVQVADIMRHVLEAQAHHAVSAHVTLISSPPPDPLLLYVDRLKLQHILGHLVANAIKFTQEGGAITLTAARSEKGELLLSVEDSGAGMSDAKLADLIAAMQEEHCWTSKDNKMVGLGLALTREFVALHGGTVQVTSKEGLGTTVHITLPKDCIRMAAPAAAPAEYLLAAYYAHCAFRPIGLVSAHGQASGCT